MPPSTRLQVAAQASTSKSGTKNNVKQRPSKPTRGRVSGNLVGQKEKEPRQGHRVGLDDIGDDVLLLVVKEGLDVQDTLSLRMTDHRLCAFTKLRSVWFELLKAMLYTHALPISRPPSFSLTTTELEEMAVRAFRLRHNLTQPEPLPVSSSRVRGKQVTSMKLVAGRWLVSSHKNEVSGKDTEYRVQCWDISGAKPVDLGARTIVTLGGDNSSLTILEAQLVRDGTEILIVLDAALYLHNAYIINRAVSFASLRLPTPEQPAYFVPPGVINRLNFSVHRDEESHHRSKRPSISSLAGDLFAYSRDALVVYVMNWREARVIILDAEQTGVHDLIVQVKLIGVYLLLVTAHGFFLFLVPESLADPTPENATDPTPPNLSPIGSYQMQPTHNDPSFWTAAISSTIDIRPRRKDDPVQLMLLDDVAPPPRPDTTEEVEINLLMFGRNADHVSRSLRHYVIRLFDVFINDGARKPLVPIAWQFNPKLVAIRTTAISHLYYSPPITPSLGPPMFQVILGPSGRMATWFCDRRATTSAEDRLTVYCAPQPTAEQPVGELRELFSNSFAKTTNMSVRGDIQDASCISFDELQGILCVGTNKGNIHVLRYTS